jgi:hypothetical protein
MPSKMWTFDPDSGGVKIPDVVKKRTEARIRAYAEEHFAGHYLRLDIRFRGQFCYVDAYVDSPMGENWPPPDSPETREAYLERYRNTPLHLCRLRYFGDEEKWGFGFFTYSNEKYSLSVFDDGSFFGTPEDAFESAASLYLSPP